MLLTMVRALFRVQPFLNSAKKVPKNSKFDAVRYRAVNIAQLHGTGRRTAALLDGGARGEGILCTSTVKPVLGGNRNITRFSSQNRTRCKWPISVDVSLGEVNA